MVWDPEQAYREQQGAGILPGTRSGNGRSRARLPDGDLVYETSRWQRYQWDRHTDDSTDANRVESDGSEKLPRFDAYMREMFSRMYAESPQRLEQPDPDQPWAQQAHELASELPEFDRLRDRCIGDRLWAGMAATSVAEEVLAAMPEPSEDLQDTRQLQQRIKGLEGLQEAGIPVGEEMATAQNQLQQAQSAAQSYAGSMDPSAMRQAIRRGCEQAQGQIQDAVDAMDAFGWGLDEGGDGRGGDIESKRKLLQKIRTSNKLKRLAQLAGRFRRAAVHKQRTKADHARDEIADITLGDDLARLLPSEAAKLANPETRVLFYKSFIEKNLLCYELKGRETQDRGPIVVCVDNSGSMAGDRELWSKAVALALLEIAKRQKRSFALLHFSRSVGCRLIWDRGPNPPEWDKVIEAMEYFSGGGTDFEPVLKEALQIIEKEGFKKADVVMVTDGAASTDFAKTYRRKAEAKEVTTYGVLIGGYGEGALGEFCDRTMSIDDVENENAATDTLFEI